MVAILDSLPILRFSLIFVGSAIASGAAFLKRLIPAVYIVGAASLAYGVIQAIGADPFNGLTRFLQFLGF
jgi:hypothetical protein